MSNQLASNGSKGSSKWKDNFQCKDGVGTDLCKLVTRVKLVEPLGTTLPEASCSFHCLNHHGNINVTGHTIQKYDIRVIFNLPSNAELHSESWGPKPGIQSKERDSSEISIPQGATPNTHILESFKI
ncbi:hypothetical protein J6590_016975 [Homalodisca vitripennis]|nr:hypothetical protein J6590_016975 [Homalodisca vitripennis]